MPGIKSYILINYIDLCSNALLPALEFFIKYNSKYTDVNTVKFKQVFLHYFFEQFKEYKKQGLKIIIFGTCHPDNNWRCIKKKGQYFCTLNDPILTIKNSDICTLLNKLFSLLQRKKSYNLLNYESVDSIDLTKVFIDLIGRCHCEVIDPKFSLLKDTNEFWRNENDVEIPKYVYSELEAYFRNKNLLN